MNKSLITNYIAQESKCNLSGKTFKVVNLTPYASISDEVRIRISEELYSIFAKYSNNTTVRRY